MPNVGAPELIIVLIIVLVIFGPKRLPGLGKQLGSGMREFKDSIAGKDDSDEHEDESTDARRVELDAGVSEPLPDGTAVHADEPEKVAEQAFGKRE